MVKESKHIIQKQVFKLDIPNKESFNDIANDVQSIFYKEILPKLDEIFTQFAPNNVTIQIDKLVIDVGEIDVKNLKRELTRRIIQTIENQLHLEFKKMDTDFYGVGNTRINRLSPERSQLRLLSYFLENGRLPWWSEKEVNLDQLFALLIIENPSLVRNLIYRLATNKYIRKRIIFQFSDQTIDALFKILTPQQANFFRTYVEDLQEVHERQKVVNETSYKFKKVVQELIFIYIIDHQQTAINQTEFAKNNLLQLAKKYRISYFEIVEQLHLAFKNTSKSQSSPFKKIAQSLFDEAVEEQTLASDKTAKTQNTQEPNKLNLIEIIETFLVYGYVNNQRFFQLFDTIESLFQSLIQEQTIAIRALIYKIGTSKNVRQRIVSAFEENTVYQLIDVLTPQQGFYFKEHVTSLAIVNEQTKIVNTKTERFKKVVQELILKYIAERKTSVFNEVDFLRHQIQNLSKNYRLNYDFVLEKLHVAIQKNSTIQSTNQFTKTIDKLYQKDIFSTNIEEEIVSYQPVHILETYLTYGIYLTDNELDINTLLFQLLKENSIATRQLIFNLKSNENVIQRLAHQFSDETTSELFRVISVQSPVFLNSFIENISYYQQQTTTISEEQKVFQKVIKEFVLIYLLNSTFSSFNQTDFTQQIISDLAKKYQISFDILMENIQTFFEVNKEQLKVSPTFVQIFKTINRQIDVKSNKSTEQENLEFDAIIEAIETGQLQTSKIKITTDFLEQLITQKADHSLLKDIFTQAKVNSNSIRQLSQLSKKASKKIWDSLSENKGDYIAELIEAFLKSQQKYRFLALGNIDLRQFLNAKTLDFLFNKTFQLKTLTHFLITEIAIKFNISERQIIDTINKKIIKNDLQQSLEIVEKEIIEAHSALEEENRAFTNLELFEFILNKGYIPASIFYAQKSVDINELFQLLLSTQHLSIQKIMRSIQHQPRKINRLVYQLNVENLQQLSNIIINQRPKWLKIAQKTIIDALHNMPNILLPISHIEQLVTEYSVLYLLTFGQQSTLIPLDFWTFLLLKLEQNISNINQEELLQQIEKQEDIKTIKVIESLNKILNSKSSALSQISKTEQTFETFNYILKNGQLPWWSVYRNIQELEKWFINLEQKEQNRWIQSIEKHYIHSKKTIGILTSLFSESFLNQIILVYSPNFGGIVISYQNSILQIKKSGTTSKELQKMFQQFTFDFFVSKQFNLKTFLSKSLDFLEQKTLLNKNDYIQQISQIAEIAALNKDYRFYALIDMLKDLPNTEAKNKFSAQENTTKSIEKTIRKLTEWEIIIYFFQNKILPKGYQNLSYNELMLLIRKNIKSHKNVSESYFRKMFKTKSRLDTFKQLVRKEEQQLIFDLINFSEKNINDESDKIERPKKKPLTIDEPLPAPIDEDIYISNAGIILIHPLLSTLFTRLKLLIFGKWKNETAQQRAVLLLHYIATEQTTASEPELVLAKLLCGWELWKPLELELDITDEEANMCQSILKGTLYNWERMRNSTPEALRQTFIKRGGKLKEEPTQWFLTVEKETFDMLLTTLDWQISMINFSWMPKLLRVDWTS